jgi:Stigma-specific protein, Stig1
VCPETSTAMQLEAFTRRCGSSDCHDRDNPALALDLVSPGLEQRLIDVPSRGCRGERLVVAGQPAQSWLFAKVADAEPSCGGGFRMPVSAPYYNDEEIACLAAWIESLGPAATPSDGGAGVDAAGTDVIVDPGISCPTGQNVCNGVCLDLATNNGNCGTCGRACGAGTTCVGGSCACTGGQTLCAGACADTATSESHCGACGRTCTTGQVCTGGTCVCTTGLTACSGGCADTTSDPNHCGACGVPCTRGTVCAGGTCVRGGCPTGTTLCGGSCVDTRSSALHCGGCNQPCPSGQTCTSGACGCAPGAVLCGGACTSTSSDPLNCGACGTMCPAGSACSGGSCGCASGLTTCGSACVNTATDPANCGGCGKMCAAGTSCSNGTCVASCASGTTLCGSSCVNTGTDPRHCGGCGKMCAAGELCLGGACQGCGPTVSFAAQVQPIFTTDCTTRCHSGSQPAGNLSLASGVAHAELVNVVSTCGGKKHVDPGSPSTSYLINKLTGVGMCSGGIMPKMGGELTAAQIATIRGWICQGAPNN